MSLKAIIPLVLCASAVYAQTSASNQITWGAVVFTYHGEKTPFLAGGSHHLTPLGAMQSFSAGQVIRDRYITGNNTSPQDNAPINGISQIEIVNSQLDVLSTDDEFMSGSAVAFMQGLYPPKAGNGPPSMSEEYRYAPGQGGLGTLIEYPLDGYQYPDIRTVNTATDQASIWIAGHVSCDDYSTAEVRYKNTTAYRNRVDSTLSFYQSLKDNVFADLPARSTSIDFRSASHLYEYALYEYLHNSSIYDEQFTDFRVSDLNTLHNLASEQQVALNSPNSIGSVSTIAGRTLAGKVFQQLEPIIRGNGYSNKLNLMFTSFEPFLSFFALSGLSNGASASVFKNIPAHGSSMVFEIFSYSNNPSPNVSQTLPPTEDLFVRFLFRDGSNASNKLQAFPMFGNSPSKTDLQYSEFVGGMDDFAMLSVPQWCSVCNTQNLFCMQLDELYNGIGNGSGPSVNGPSTSHQRLAPAVYGAIGAVITLGVIIAGFVLLAILGFKLEKHEKKNNRNSDLGHLRTNSGNGGFKGAEKLASDTDLTLKGGAGATVIRHERIGSWELKDGPTKPSPSLDKDLESGRVRSIADYGRKSDDYDDLRRINPFGDPVKPVDQV